MREVVTTIFVAILLVVGVVFLFLQTWRASLIPVIAIPVSLVGTFTILLALGISLNNLSLFGLVLAVGIVVDDAIVVVENVERNIAAGMTPKEAAHRTMDEVGGALVSIALTLCAVFVPSAFLSGISGQFFRQFAVTIAASTVISCFVSLTLSPALCALLLKPHDPHQAARGNLAGRLLRAAFGALQSRVRANVGRLRRADPTPGARPAVVVVVYVGLIGAAGFEFARDADRLHSGAGPGLPHHRPAASARRQPGADRAGGEAGDRHHPENAGRRACRAVRRAGRDDVHGRVQFGDDLLRPAVALQPQHSGGHGDLGAGRSAQAAFGDPGCLRADDPAAAGAGHRQFRRLQDDAGGSRGARHPGAGERRERACGGGQQGPELRRRVHAAQCRVAVGLCRHRPPEGREGRADADRRVRHAAGLSRLAIRQRLQFPGQNLRGDRPGGQPLPARPAGPDGPEGAQRERRDGADRNGRAICRIRRSPIACRATISIPAAEVQGVAAPGVATGTALQRMETLAAQVLPPGIGYEWTEIAFQQEQKGTPTMLVFGAAALFVFLVLAANYESWKLPLSVVLIVPMCLLASVTGLLFRGMPIDILAQIGFVVLVGLAAKNAILIVEFARQAQDAGSTPGGGGDQCRAAAAAADPDDVARLHSRRRAAGGRDRRRGRDAAIPGHRRLRRHAGVTGFGLIFTPAFYTLMQRIGIARDRASSNLREPRNQGGRGQAAVVAPTPPGAGH